MSPQTQPQDENWEEVGGSQLVKWDAAKVIEGVFQVQGEVTGQFGKQMKASVMLDDGSVVEFYEPAVLERIMTDPRIQKGVRVRVEYTGTSEKTSTGRMAKSFKVGIKA